MIVSYGLLALAYDLITHGNFKLLGASTYSMSTWSFSGGAANWFAPLVDFYERGLWIPGLLPAFLIISAVVWWLGGRHIPLASYDLLLAFICYGGLVAALSLALHLIFSFGMLSLFYYTIYLLPASMLLLLGVAGCAVKNYSSFGQISLFVVSVTLLALWLMAGASGNMIQLSTEQTALIIFGLVIFGAIGHALNGFIPVAAMVGITFLSVFEYGTGRYNIRNTRIEAAINQWDVYRGSVEFQTWVGEVAPVGSALRFWYPREGEATALNSIQSMYLWGYSNLTSHPYPEITHEVKEAILAQEFLCLIALDDAGLAAGLASIEAQGIAFEEVARFAHDGEVWDFRSVMIRLPKQP
jgi:hypothetical protein